MASGINIYHSRRINYNRCLYWERDESGIGNEDELIYKKKPSGVFYATESNVETNSMNMLAGVFMTGSASESFVQRQRTVPIAAHESSVYIPEQ